MWIHQRLQGALGGQTSAEVKGQQDLPQLRMLRRDSSEDDWSVIGEEEPVHYAQTADMDELRAMVAQSRRISEDPHNRMQDLLEAIEFTLEINCPGGGRKRARTRKKVVEGMRTRP